MSREQVKGAIVCAGDIVPDILIPYGQTLDAIAKLSDGCVTTSNPSLRPGGAVANTAAVLGKLGMCPIMLGGLGSDEYGDYLLSHMKDCKVQTEYVFRQPERMSLVLAVLDNSGERVLYLYNGPGAKLPELSEDTLPYDLIPKIGWLHTNGFANNATVDFMERCRAAGAMVSFDLNLRCETFDLDKVRRRRLERAVQASNVILGSGAEEFSPLTGETDIIVAAKVLCNGERVVVARDGANPIHLFDHEAYQCIPVTPVKAVNKVGGGDAFNAGFIAAYALGHSAVEAVRWGCQCAVAAISSHEPHNAPLRAELESDCKKEY